MHSLGPTLETARLILRPPMADDLEGLAAMMADEDTARFIGGVAPRTVCWRQLASLAGSWALHGFGMFSVIEKDTGAWIGRLGPWRPEGWPGTEVGYGLIKAATGKGYATEGCVAAMDWAVHSLGWTDLIHCIDEKNFASQAVATRLGSRFRAMGQMPAPFQNDTTQIWGQTAAEWKAAKR